MKRILAIVFAVSLCLSACKIPPKGDTQATVTTQQTEKATEPSVAPTTAPTVSVTQSDEEMFTDRDGDATYDEEAAVKISLSGSKASATSDAVKINGSTVKITEAATYVVSGTLDDGMLVVDAPKDAKVQG